MTSDQYNVTPTNLSNLTRVQTAAYREMSIINSMNESMVLIDNQNNKSVVPPSTGGISHEECVTIFRRSCISPTVTEKGAQMQMPGISIKLDKYRFRNNPVYVREVDLLICTEAQAANAIHPFSQSTYRESLEGCIDKLSATIDSAPTIKILVNDPTGSFEKLYTILDNTVVSVPVTHDAGEEPQLLILTVREGKYYTEQLSLAALLSGTTNTVSFTNRVIPWITTSELNATEMAKTFSWITPDTFVAFKTSAALETKRAVEQANAAASAKINELTTQVTTLEAEMSRIESERDDYKFKYNNIRADLNARVDNSNQYMSIMKAQNDFSMSQGNLQMTGYKLQCAQQESQLKLWHVVLAAGLPVLAAIALKAFNNN